MEEECTAFETAVLAACTQLLAPLGPIGRLVVALSGGRDSVVLLQALAACRARLAGPLVALHVDHALQAESGQWVEACRVRCETLEVSLSVVTLSGEPAPGESVEAWARTARYEAFARHLGPHDVVLTAHHEDDNAETFLLNALRGSGAAGLRGIAPSRALGRGWLCRPLLGIATKRLAQYAARRQLTWDEDPMNAALNFDRSYLRHQVVPTLRSHWPAWAQTLSRSARLQREGVLAIDRLADEILDAAGLSRTTQLSCEVLAAQAPEVRGAVLRRWIARAGFPTPMATHVERMLTCVLGARTDRVPVVIWKGVCVRRYAGILYLLPAPVRPASPFAIGWDPTRALQLPEGMLSARWTVGEGIRADLTGPGLSVRSRLGGERCQLPGRAQHHTLKHVLQDLQIPPWERPGLPLVYIGEQLAAVANLFVCADFLAQPGQAAWQPEWIPVSGALAP